VGVTTFLQLPRLAQALDAMPPARVVRLKVWALVYMDHSCAELVSDWIRRRSASGDRVEVNHGSAMRYESIL